MPSREENQAALDQMCDNYLEDVDATRRTERKAPLSDDAKDVFRRLLNDPRGAHENLLQAIDEGNLLAMMTPVGPGQGSYSAPSKALCIEPSALEQASRDRAVEYNLNFTLAHECRHARDGEEIRDMTGTMHEQIIAKMQEPELPHDYTRIVRDYLDRDRMLEQRAETTGLNAHVSKVVADMDDRGRQATLKDVYDASPRDMAPYIDITPAKSMFGSATYAYKDGFVVQGDGLHLDANDPRTLAAMGTHFYDAQNYDWRQGLKATLNVINNAESSPEAVTDPQRPPRIDFNALGVGPAPDTMCRDTMQHVVDSNLRMPNAIDSPDRGYFQALRDTLPKVDDAVVAYAMLEAKRGGLEDPSRVVPGETGQADNGRIWISGNRGERIEVDPDRAPSLARTAQHLDTHAFVRAQQETQQAPEPEQSRKQSNCAVM